GDDVALDFGCPAVDGRRQRVLTFEQQVCIVDRGRPGGRSRKFPDPLQGQRTEEFENVSFWAWPAGELVVQRAVAGRAQRFGVGEQRAELSEYLSGRVVVVRGVRPPNRIESALDLDPVH